MRHCVNDETPAAEDNVMLVRLAPTVTDDLAALRRNMYASSSCGVCGKASIEAAMALPELAAVAPYESQSQSQPPLRIDVDTLASLPDRLRAQQLVFARTGGLHGAGLFSVDGTALVVREDVGRHNAVDKAIGWAARERVEFSRCVLMVSGRVSFEIIQKALALGIPIVAAVSAPTSLAVELATTAGISLVGFVRDRRLCVYAGAERIVAAVDDAKVES
jgi:FdhD protein